MSDSILPVASFGLVNSDDASATAAQILSGYTAYAKGSKISGSMTNRGNVSVTLNAGGSYTIPVGYHAGGGTVRANSLASQTAGTATAADIISGKTAWVNGILLTGAAAAGSQVATGTETIDSSTFSFSCGFRPSQFVVFMFREYKSSNLYQYASSRRFISLYYNGSTLYEFGINSVSDSSIYFNGASSGSVTLSSTGATIKVASYTPYSNGTPIRWVAWS